MAKKLYCRPVAEAFCEALASGATTEEASKKIGLSRVSTIFKWIARYPEFAVMYRRAQSARGFRLAEEMMRLSDSPLTRDAQVRSDAAEKARLAQLKLQIDTRKWLFTKLHSRTFERPQEPEDAPAQTVMVLSAEPMTEEEWLEKYGVDLGAAAGAAEDAD